VAFDGGPCCRRRLDINKKKRFAVYVPSHGWLLTIMTLCSLLLTAHLKIDQYNNNIAAILSGGGRFFSSSRLLARNFSIRKKVLFNSIQLSAFPSTH
jgi:hypothetical protein